MNLSDNLIPYCIRLFLVTFSPVLIDLLQCITILSHLYVMMVLLSIYLVTKVTTVSPIHAACQLSTEQAPAIVQCLLDYTADPNAPEFPCSQCKHP